MSQYRLRKKGRLVLLLAALASQGSLVGQVDIDREPINYSSREPSDRIYELSKRIAEGAVRLEWDEKHGWLPALLKALGVPRSSQTLVFSKTSLQFRHIDPSRPRALYFNDDTYVGWVLYGDNVELAAVDREYGAMFYTVEQARTEQPEIKRDRGECMSCHANPRTQRVPGFLVRSVIPLSDGQPDFRLGTLTTDHRTEFRDRFGGWYVTGSHGKMRHRGNVFLQGDSDDSIDREAGANLMRLPPRVRADAYLEPGSDLVALMLLEHQTQMHNLVTRASYTTRQSLHQQEAMNEILDRPTGYRSESVTRRIHRAAEELLKYLFFYDEYPISSEIKGSSSFAVEFSSNATRDSKGRSLKDLDLERRLFRYPCSYLVYSESFLSLPEPVLTLIKSRMVEILSGEDRSEPFSHLFSEDRQDILTILSETHRLFRKTDENTR